MKDEPEAELEDELESPPVSVWVPQEFFEPQPEEPDAREPQIDSWNDEPAPLAPQPASEPTREPEWKPFQAQGEPFPPSLPPPAPVPEIARQLIEEATARSIEEAAAKALQEAAARAMQEAAAASEPRAPASATEIAAQPEPGAETAETAAVPGFVERGRIRRRARYLRRLREVQLRDIGGFVVELHRFERERPDLVGLKVEGARRTQAELQALRRALGEGSAIRELRVAGIGSACVACGAVHGSEDRYCASCGEALRPELYTPDEAAEPGPDGRR